MRLSIRLSLSLQLSLSSKGIHLALELRVNSHRGISRESHLCATTFPTHLPEGILDCWHLSSIICSYFYHNTVILGFSFGLSSSQLLAQILIGLSCQSFMLDKLSLQPLGFFPCLLQQLNIGSSPLWLSFGKSSPLSLELPLMICWKNIFSNKR